jgi:peptidyl-prolyl cis-trans isomerase A (cyclophilin A)
MKKIAVVLSTLLVLVSCKNNSENLKDGIYAIIETSKGDITARLDYQNTPITVANFITLAEGKNNFVNSQYKGIHYYDGLIFHRVESNPPVVQTGDPTATGSGGPGYTFIDEQNPKLNHDTVGVLGMAKGNAPNTNGSQFYITYDKASFLNNNYTVFGEVLEGLDIVSTIAKGDELNKVTILRIGNEAKKFDAVKVFQDYYNLEFKKSNEIKLEKVKEFQTVKKNLTTTTSRLSYQITKTTNNSKPKVGDEILINYTGYLEDGTLFDTSIATIAEKYNMLNKERQAQNGYQPINFTYGQKEGLIPGFIEGMEKLKYGEKATLIIPSHLGYGQQGSGAIPPNATTIFEIELLKK